MKPQLKNVRHDYIRYANCWEDADLLLAALEIKESDKVFSIASAGDNCLACLSQNPEIVLAVDVNPIQLKLLELKKAVIQTLNHQDFLKFLGFEICENRWELFQKVKENLEEKTKLFWENKKAEIENGIIFQGKFENYFALFRKYILPLIHSKKTINRLFEPKNKENQEIFFNKTWNNFRWKLLFKIFFSKAIMGKYGRDKAFLNEVKIPVSRFVFEKAKQHLSSEKCQQNYFLEFILKGKFESNLPHYARKENYEKIKKNISKLKLFNGFAEEALAKFGSFDKFNLSNIFEYMSLELFQNITKELEKNATQNAIFAFWNLMVSRKISKISETITADKTKTNQLNAKDKGFFYQQFLVETKT